MASDDLKKPTLHTATAPPQAPLTLAPPTQMEAEWDSGCCHCCGSPCTCCPGWGICGLVCCSLGSCLFALNQKRAFGISTAQAVGWGVLFFFLASFFGIVGLIADYANKLRCMNAAIEAVSIRQINEEAAGAAMINCMTRTSVAGIVLAVLASVAALALIGVGAWRRMMIRERFGIKGSPITDLCLWFWCSPCALCQETRTLELKGAREGVWHGTPPLPRRAAAAAPPAAAAAASPPPLASPPTEEKMSKIV